MKYVLNVRFNNAFSSLLCGNCAMDIFILFRAFGGRRERNIRGMRWALAKGLNLAEMLVR